MRPRRGDVIRSPLRSLQILPMEDFVSVDGSTIVLIGQPEKKECRIEYGIQKFLPPETPLPNFSPFVNIVLICEVVFKGQAAGCHRRLY